MDKKSQGSISHAYNLDQLLHFPTHLVFFSRSGLEMRGEQ